jgi:hypothetical protein
MELQKTNEFNIGDRVMSNLYGKTGVINDKLYSNKLDDWMYTIKFDDNNVPYPKPLLGRDLERIDDNKEYRFEIFQAENVMVAVMYEIDGDTERELSRYHGHIMHEGLLGVVQAASYAMKKLYTNFNGGVMLTRDVEVAQGV